MGNDFENKELLELMLRSLKDPDDLAPGEEEPDDELVRTCLETMKSEAARLLDPQERSAWLLAASEKKKSARGECRCASAYGVAVDADARKGTVIECVAFLSRDSVHKGEVEFIVQEVTGIKRGRDKFEITSPFDSLRNKLKQLFLHNPYLERFKLSNRESVVEIVPAKGELAVIREAKSLELAVVMALISTVVGKPIGEDILFSGSVRLDGTFQAVGDVPLKLAIAKKAGKREVILPESNRVDCPGKFLSDPQDFSVKFFSHVSQVTQYLELPYEPPLEPSGEGTGRKAEKKGMPALGKESKGLWQPSSATSAKETIVEYGLKIGVAEKTVAEVMEVAEDLTQMRNERKPVSTALVVGDRKKIAALLPPAEIRLRKKSKIATLTNQLALLSTVVNGEDMGFLINKQGKVDSIRKLNIDLRGDYGLSRLLGWTDYKCALISAVTESMVFYLTPSSNRIHVFSSGEFISKFINAMWCATNLSDLEKRLVTLASEKAFDRNTVMRVARCALRMSWLNLGALFAVFSENTDLEGKLEDRLKALGLEFSPRPLDNLTDEELINLAKEDGATLIDGSGLLRSFRAFLRPSSRVELDFEPGAGSRRISAQRFSHETSCLTVVVSEDGGVSFFSNGKRVFRT